MFNEYLISFKLAGTDRLTDAVVLALDQVKGILESRGVLLEGWDYDGTEGLLLIHLRTSSDWLGKVSAEIERIIREATGSTVELVSLSSQGFVEAKGLLPSPLILGFLMRAWTMRGKYNNLNEVDVMALLLFYFTGYDRARAFLTAPFIGIEPESIEKALRKLVETGYLNSDLSSLSKKGEQLLDTLIPKLRVRPLRPIESLNVIDEEGRLEPFSLDRLASSLYRSGVPPTFVYTILKEITRIVRRRRYISKKALTTLVQSLLEEAGQSPTLAVRFYNYVYALDKLYITRDGESTRMSWSQLRRLSSEVLGERGLSPPPRVVEILSELVAEEVRARVSALYWRLEGQAIDWEELKQLAKLKILEVSYPWAELASTPFDQLSQSYRLLGEKYLQGALESDDFGRRKELAVRGLLFLSSSMLLSLGTLPSNIVEVNLGSLRSMVRKASVQSGVKADLARFCNLARDVLHCPAAATPSEQNRLRRALHEIISLMEKLEKGFKAQT